MNALPSKPAFNNHLDLFQLTNSDVSTTNSVFVPIYSITNIKEDQVPLEFAIPGLPGVYIDLSESFLYLRVHVLVDGKPTKTGDDVSTTNLFLHSLFECLELYFQGKLVSSKNYYHYCSYLLAHLSYSRNYKKDILQSALYVEDVNANVQSEANDGYKTRAKFISNGKVLELCGPLFDDLMCQDRWILPGVDIRIRLKRSLPEFCLLAPVDTIKYTVKIEEAVFYAKRQMVAPAILEIHEKQLERSCALYPYISNLVKIVSIPKASKSAVFENLFSSNKLPQVVLIAFCNYDGFNGKFTKNPYFFEHFKLNNLNLSVDNVAMEYRNLNLSFNTKYLLAFQTLMQGLNLEHRSVGLNRNNYIDGNVLFAFQLLGFEGDTSFTNRVGSLKLEVSFTDALADQVIGVILSQTQNLLTIDKYRNIEVENQGIF